MKWHQAKFTLRETPPRSVCVNTTPGYTTQNKHVLGPGSRDSCLTGDAVVQRRLGIKRPAHPTLHFNEVFNDGAC